MNRLALLLIIVLVLAAGAMPVRADFAAGKAAYEEGDYETAYNIWLPLAEAGDTDSQFGMGHFYRFGDDRPVNMARALQWFAKAAKQGHVTSLKWLGDIYAGGEGMPKDLKRAECLYIHAAQRGDVISKWAIRSLLKKLGRQNESDIWLARALAESDAEILFTSGGLGIFSSNQNHRIESYAELLLAEERGHKQATEDLSEARASWNVIVKLELAKGWLMARKWRAMKATPPSDPEPVEDSCLPE